MRPPPMRLKGERLWWRHRRWKGLSCRRLLRQQGTGAELKRPGQVDCRRKDAGGAKLDVDPDMIR
jgi:hypothetical protein